MHYSVERNIHTKKLEELIDADFEMVSVPVRVDKLATHSDCYKNVERKVKGCGGRIQYGWSIFQNELMCEAQHHAVWENRQADLIDITPNPLRSNSILFIPDDRIIYEGKNIDSIRMNITENAVVDDFVAIAEIREMILANANRTSENRLTTNSIGSILYNKYQQLGKEILLFILAGHGPSNTCFCNSGKAYNECHGAGLLEMINADKAHLPEEIIRLQTQS